MKESNDKENNTEECKEGESNEKVEIVLVPDNPSTSIPQGQGLSSSSRRKVVRT